LASGPPTAASGPLSAKFPLPPGHTFSYATGEGSSCNNVNATRTPVDDFVTELEMHRNHPPADTLCVAMQGRGCARQEEHRCEKKSHCVAVSWAIRTNRWESLFEFEG